MSGWGAMGWGGGLSSGGGTGGGGTPPSVANFSPVAGTPISSGTPLEFDILTPQRLVALVIAVRYGETGAAEVAYDRDGWTANFKAAGSEMQMLPEGRHVVLRRRGGWFATPTIVVEGSDYLGNAIPE